MPEAARVIPMRRLSAVDRIVLDLETSRGKLKRRWRASPLGDAFFYQVASKFTDAALTEQWRLLQSSIVPSDDLLRGLSRGEHVLCQAPPFAVSVKLTAPRKLIDADLLKQALVENGMAPAEADKVLAAARRLSRVPVEKRIVEIVR